MATVNKPILLDETGKDLAGAIREQTETLKKAIDSISVSVGGDIDLTDYITLAEAVNTFMSKTDGITGLSVEGTTITYTKGDGTTGTITTQDTNTTYEAMTASEANSGVSTTAKVISAKVLNDKIVSVVEDNAYTLPNASTSVTGGVSIGSNISVTEGKISVEEASTTKKGVVRLSTSTFSTSESLAATASAVKAVYDLANSKQSPATTLDGYGIADAYTKSEVDDLVANAGGGSGGSGSLVLRRW